MLWVTAVCSSKSTTFGVCSACSLPDRSCGVNGSGILQSCAASFPSLSTMELLFDSTYVGERERVGVLTLCIVLARVSGFNLLCSLTAQIW